MDDERIAEGLLTFKNTGMRQNIYDYNGTKIIRDCYNANPDSMRASLSVLKGFESEGKKIAVLGDMNELGENADVLHEETGEFAASSSDVIFVTGRYSAAYKKGGAEKVLVFEDKETLAKKLSETIKNGDVVLVKGSYGTKMWQVLEYLQGKEE